MLLAEFWHARHSTSEILLNVEQDQNYIRKKKQKKTKKKQMQ